MTNFLEELYFGNLDPQARGYRKGNHIWKVSENINELEEKLTQHLNDEEKKLFLDFCNAYGELMGDIGLDSFIVGFRLGAKIDLRYILQRRCTVESYLKE